MELINIYCDESCHLPADKQRIMVLGGLWCPSEKAHEISRRLKEIKAKHGMAPEFETKWTKVSNAKLDYYRDVLDYFFDDDNLHFRALIADKTKLDHATFGQDHDTWYYKMYFQMLNVLFSPKCCYRIYMDIKDTKSNEKVKKLHEVLCNNHYDFDRKIIQHVQQVRSHEIEQMQLADLLIGAISYVNRGLAENKGKVALVERVRERSKYTLLQTTLLGEKKLNLFHWQSQGSSSAL